MNKKILPLLTLEDDDLSVEKEASETERKAA